MRAQSSHKSVYSEGMFDWSLYTGNLKWLPARTFYLTRHGSHAYGTSLPTSDLDLRGVFIAPKEYYLGFAQVVEQVEQKEPDFVLFELRKFLKLATDANPNVLELLYTDDSDHLVTSPVFEMLRENRHMFLSRKAKHTFSGYAVSQLKRINTHYRWLKNPPTAAPTRAEFGLPERTVIPADQLAAANAAIQKQVDIWSWHDLEDVDPAIRQSIKDEFTRRLAEITSWGWAEMTEKTWLAASRAVGLDTNFIQLLDQERRYTGKLREWQQFNDWKKNRNPDRAILEEKYGYDTKHGMHLVRLLRMCREILTDGKVLVRRPDAEELLRIRAGDWDYHKLVEWAEAQDAELEVLAKTSKLPNAPDRKKLDQLCIEMVEASFR